MSEDPVRLVVRCRRRILAEVDAEGMVLMKCRDCSKAYGRPVYHEVTIADLQDRRGLLTIPDPDAENHPKAA